MINLTEVSLKHRTLVWYFIIIAAIGGFHVCGIYGRRFQRHALRAGNLQMLHRNRSSIGGGGRAIGISNRLKGIFQIVVCLIQPRQKQSRGLPQGRMQLTVFFHRR